MINYIIPLADIEGVELVRMRYIVILQEIYRYILQDIKRITWLNSAMMN